MDIFPERLVGWTDIARGVGEVALSTLRNALKRHSSEPTLSDHFQPKTPPEPPIKDWGLDRVLAEEELHSIGRMKFHSVNDDLDL